MSSNHLDEYSRKRSFSKTPEPAPGQPASQSGNRFCVQRHFARRLHYDFRLEIGGTLKSWAVPQGPSLDPADKRLAVMVEDHPLEYGSFEGNIPKGNYGAGSVMLWDEGAFEMLGEKTMVEQLDRGDFKFRLHGRKLSGEFAIVRMKNRGKGNEWLLLKKKDASAMPGWDIEKFAQSVSTGRTQEEIAQDMPATTAPPPSPQGSDQMPERITPMLAYSSDDVPTGADWVYEVKWDGVRTLCHVRDARTTIYSRKGTPMDAQYPELSVLHHHFAATTAILDGEVAVLDEAGRPSFHRIQPRIMATDPNSIAHMARARPAVFFAFDLLYLDGKDLRRTPLAERKSLLASRIRPNMVLRYSEHFDTGGPELLALARQQGLEGIVAKRASSHYVEARSRDWIKVKVFHEQEFVLCGFTKGERDFFGALVLGVYDDNVLRFAGGVGTGFDRKLMQAIHERLLAVAAPECPLAPCADLPEATWTRPELVCTVRFHSWTESEDPVNSRLRAPVFVGLRPDSDPRDCLRHPAAPPQRTPLLPADKDEVSVKVEGQLLRFKNLNKIYYPKDAITKREVLNYYDAVADLLLPHWTGRPLSLRRYPDGIAQEGFFQKRADIGGMPDWVRTERILAEDHKEREQVIGGGRADLLYLTNLGCIDQNPWMSSSGTLDHPDYVLIDLDPYECGFDRIVEAAQLVKRQLDKIGLAGYPKTTGGDGMHIYIPLEPVYSYEMTKSFAEILARLAAAERPDLFTTPRTVARREKGKVYFDHLQNGRGKTISAPYVLRAYDGAPVATPLDWREVRPGLHPSQFHLRNALDRFEQTGDLFAGVLKNRQRLESAMERFQALLG